VVFGQHFRYGQKTDAALYHIADQINRISCINYSFSYK